MPTSRRLPLLCDGCSWTAECKTYRGNPDGSAPIQVTSIAGAFEPTGELVATTADGYCETEEEFVTIALGTLSVNRQEEYEARHIPIHRLPLAKLLPGIAFNKVSEEMISSAAR